MRASYLLALAKALSSDTADYSARTGNRRFRRGREQAST